MPGAPLTHIYLSPHLDDAVFSCGGRLRRHVQAGARAVVVTVCAGNPPAGPLSPFAQSLHVRWSGEASPPAAPAEIVTRRRAEDLAALAELGAEAVHLDVADAPYRLNPAANWPMYTTDEALKGPLHPTELNLVRRIAGKLTTLLHGFGRHHLYVPLAIGGHVDHQLTRRAAEVASGIYALYEDYPYVAREGDRWPDPAQTQIHGRPLTPEIVHLSEDDLAAKLAAMGRYASQLSTFWPDAPTFTAEVRAFAERTGGGIPAERVWRLG
jgi:LmbE family N-acetylglucosaminyl deacetylase